MPTNPPSKTLTLPSHGRRRMNTRPKNPDPKAYLAKIKRESNKEKLEGAFMREWCSMETAMPTPTREYRFHPVRKWRWDFAWEDIKLAVEIHGGGQRGRHASIAGMTADCDKHNAAVGMGWRVLTFTSKHTAKDMARHTLAVMLGLDPQ